MIADGIYKVFSLMHGDSSHTRTYLGRFSVMNRALHVLEDHHNILHGVLTDGILDPQIEDRLERLIDSPNIEVLSEADIHAGHDDVPDAPASNILPTETLDVTEQNGNRRVLEVYGENDLRMDGKSLSADERQLLTQKIKNGILIATHRQ